jgi:fido (protein-threonine AMPylation protein)
MPDPSSSPHRWNQIKRLSLHPHIQSLADYEEAIVEGVGDAIVYLGAVDVFEGLTVADLQAVHFHLFRAVHPWAGEFRSPGQMAVVAGFPAADPPRIRRELELVLHQTRQLLASAYGDETQLLAALSFLHIRFERIHPFQDGNGRSGRTVLAAQFERIFGRLPDFSDQRGYRDAIRATASGNLGSFLHYLGRSAGLTLAASAWPNPYRLAPRFLEAHEREPSFEEDLQWSASARRGGP